MHDNSNDFDPTPTDETLAAMFSALTPVTPPAGLEAKVLARIAAAPKTLVTVRADADGWREVAPGVRIKVLAVDAATNIQSLLVEMDAGASVPAHDHVATEECIIIRGEVAFGDIVARAGDFHLAPAGIPHGPIYSEHGVLMYARGDYREFGLAFT